MIYCFDIDGTLCTNTDGEYQEAEPYPDMIGKINALYDAGDQIILYTARGSSTGIDWHELTKDQLCRWGVKYYALHFGKPHADVYIDDKAMDPHQWAAKQRTRG